VIGKLIHTSKMDTYFKSTHTNGTMQKANAIGTHSNPPTNTPDTRSTCTQKWIHTKAHTQMEVQSSDIYTLTPHISTHRHMLYTRKWIHIEENTHRWKHKKTKAIGTHFNPPHKNTQTHKKKK